MASERQILISEFWRAYKARSLEVPVFTDHKGTKPFLPPEAFTGNGFRGNHGDMWAMATTYVILASGKVS
ncbi:hypothetical protein L596_000285 [Steinernema carpocapsae]|uniref:Protein kinase domain-containing protein n=1 Tax=Steinernema carpocapsae TaxID=34508 RepID=A0A4U8UHP3_STECR|nr:hypothetical protein L596_000285 [Steinernema carpocapsae]